MNSRKFKGAHLLIAAAVAALVVMPIALANANGPAASKRVSAAKQLRALTKRVNGLETLAARVATLEAGKTPTTLPPSGPAGGALTGTYPNPSIRAAEVGATQIAPGAVDGSKILDGSIGAGDLGPLSVGAASLKGAFTVTQPVGGVKVEANQTKLATATCPAGTRLLSGGPEWASTSANGSAVISSGPTTVGDPNTTWEVQGRVDAGGTTNTLLVDILCIAG